MIFGLSKDSFALFKKDRDIFRGTLISLDTVKNEAVVSDGGTTRTYPITPAQANGIKKGQRVLVILKNGSKVPDRIQPILRTRGRGMGY